MNALNSIHVINQQLGENFAMYHADSCEAVKAIPDNSIHFQIMSCPFSSLFVYSNSTRDMGNSKDDKQFFEHYKFLVREQLRVAIPGRLCAIHVMQLPSSKTTHGVIGLRDFRGECIKIFVDAGWIYHSEVCIWKDPAVAMMRTKALGLLHKQLRKDSCMSRQGIADYLVIFRKPGDNPERVEHTSDSFTVPTWQRYASPVWATAEELDDEGFAFYKATPADDGWEGNIDQGNTLNFRSAREHKDERHICALQLGVIKRAIRLWSNPGDTVASFFGGIGSEGVAALQMGRKFLGFELKESYFKQACANLANSTVHLELALD